MQVPEDGAAAEEALPSGELVFKQRTALQKFGTSLKLMRALPWRRFKKGSVLTIEACRALLINSSLCAGCWLPPHAAASHVEIFQARGSGGRRHH